LGSLNSNSAYLVLNNRISEKFISDEAYFNNIAIFIAGTGDEKLKIQLPVLLNKKRFLDNLNASTKEIEKFGKKKWVRTDARMERIWILHKSVLLKYASTLSEFAIIRANTERALLLGCYDDAERNLNLCKEKFGESLWYIRNLITLYSLQARNEELQNFCLRCKDRSGDKLFRYIINCFQLITDSDDASLRLKNLVQTYIDEFSEGKQQGAASLLGLLFIPAPLNGSASYGKALEIIQIFPIIDQYVMLLQWMQYAVVDSVCVGLTIFPGFELILSDLAKSIDDTSLSTLLKYLRGQSVANLTKKGEQVAQSYAEGKYELVIETFNNFTSEIENPVAYANIVAKSYAHLKYQSFTSSSKSTLEKFITELTKIYVLAADRKQAEQAIISIIVKFRGSLFFPHLQLCLYKAMPMQHPQDKLRQAAMLAMTSNLETTPLTSLLGNCKTEFFGYRYPMAVAGEKTYQSVRAEISECINTNLQDQDFELMFENLRSYPHLKKDFLEFYAEYCIFSKNTEKLLDFAAQNLAVEPNTYICFPMEELLQNIEENRICSMNAVIVAYFYLQNISRGKEYVLNEAFEEYIVLAEKVRRPSELLIRLDTCNAIQQLFFKDICMPDLMDFLNCFRNTNELRAERVKLLELLQEKNLIESSDRMREVEKIVSQVAIDAGISEFNRAKIVVDEIAIFRRRADELNTLFFTFQSAKDEGDDRVTVLEQSPGADESTNYVSGSKNSLVLKMYNILRAGFLYDEMHGFDKNLSTEIRHGFFSNLMRARLQEKNLITEIDEDGNYKSNIYWENENSFLTTKAWSKIDECLRQFSIGFNALISEAEGWMKIGESPDGKRIFTYTFSLSDFAETKRIMTEATSVNEVVAFIFGLLWCETEAALAVIRERINVDLKDNIDSLFDTLTTDISEIKGNAAMVGLMTAISHARDDIKEDITTVAEWFKRDKSSGMEGRLLNYVVEIAISSFEEVKGSAFGIERNISDDLRLFKISGKSVKSFIIAVTNLLDNCYRRSGLGMDTRVEILGFLCGKGAKIIIKNDVSQLRANELSDLVISSIDERMRAPDSIDYMRKEGGSGISKAYNEIASLSSESDLQIAYNGSHFSAIITYEP
jgi:hypothetical protein